MKTRVAIPGKLTVILRLMKLNWRALKKARCSVAFGGTAPLIYTWLISETADITSPAYFIISLGVVSLIAAFKLNSKYGDSAVYK